MLVIAAVINIFYVCSITLYRQNSISLPFNFATLHKNQINNIYIWGCTYIYMCLKRQCAFIHVEFFLHNQILLLIFISSYPPLSIG